MNSAAFFDLDGTLLPGSSLFPLARALHRHGLIRFRDVARVGADQARFRLRGDERPDALDRSRALTLHAIRGRSREALVDVARHVVRFELLPRLYPRAVQLVTLHQRAGSPVYLVTSSPEDYASLLAAELSMDGALGTLAEVADGRYTGRLDGPLNHGRHKAERVQAFADERGIDLASSIAFSDSVNDLPMLNLVGHAVAVNPDRTLHAVATRLSWPILNVRGAEVPAKPAPAVT